MSKKPGIGAYLLSCPFCGYGAVVTRTLEDKPSLYHVECSLCNGKHGPCLDKYDAINGWNTRSQTKDISYEES